MGRWWNGGGMVWEDGGMVWEGGGMMLKIIRSIAINFCKRSTKPKKVFRSSEIHMIIFNFYFRSSEPLIYLSLHVKICSNRPNFYNFLKF